ncbi:MAG: hypothetical protein AAF525_04615 [Pseudomonadota bacterium]
MALILTAFSTHPVTGQATMTAERTKVVEFLAMRRQAVSDVRAGRGAAALQAYLTLIEQNPVDSTLWLGLAHSYIQTNQPLEAIPALEKSLELGAGTVAGPGFRHNVYIGLARMHARLNDVDAMFTALNGALASRLTDRTQLTREPDFGRFLEDPRFMALVGQINDDHASRIQGWRSDLDLYEEEVRRMYIPTIKSPSPPADFTEGLSGLRRQIKRMTDAEITFELMRLTALLGSGHSVLFPTPMASLSLQSLPIDVYVFDDGIFIVGAAEPHTDLVGAELLLIGDTAPDELMAQVAPYLPRDNPMGIRWMAPFMMGIPALLAELGVIETDDDPITIKFQHEDQEPVSLSLQPGAPRMNRRLPPRNESGLLSDQRIDQPYWYTRVDPSTVYFQYNQILSDEKNPLPGFFSGLHGALMTDTKHLIIDLRRNNGGNSFYNRMLVRSLIAFEMASPSHRVTVLQGRNTFSAAQNLATDIDRMTNATFVGEPSGSSPNHVGEDSQLLLPYSGLAVGIASRYFQASDPTDDRIWIAPDIYAPPRASDYFAGRDLAMTMALELGDTER